MLLQVDGERLGLLSLLPRGAAAAARHRVVLRPVVMDELACQDAGATRAADGHRHELNEAKMKNKNMKNKNKKNKKMKNKKIKNKKIKKKKIKKERERERKKSSIF